MVKTAAEISEIAARNMPHIGAEHDIDLLRHAVEQAAAHVGPFMDFIPIRLTTIIEHVVRGIVQEAVDHGDPYAARGIAMISKWSGKTIADALLAFSEKKVTLGQLVSHGFSSGRLKEIIAALEAILGDGISEQLGTIRTKWVESERNDPNPIIADREDTMTMIDRLLTVRHIVVHERPRKAPFSGADIMPFIEHANKFASALSWIKIDRLYGEVAYTQSEMNAIAGNKAAEVLEELDALRGGTAADFEAQQDDFQRLEFHWDQFVDLAARKYAGYMDEGWPGTIAPLLYASAKETMMRWRIQQIKSLGDRWSPA